MAQILYSLTLIAGQFERHAGLHETKYTSAELHYPARRQLINWPTNGEPVHPDHNAGGPRRATRNGRPRIED